MTAPLSASRPGRPTRRLDPLSAHLQLVRDRTGRDVLLESFDGEIVAYALGPQVSNAVCAAVLTRSAAPLRTGLRTGRTVALATAGPVRSGRIDGQTATIVPVPGNPPGRMWFLGPDVTHVDAPVQALLEALRGLGARLAQLGDIDVAGLLEGQPIPAALAAGTCLLLVAEGDLPPGVAVESLSRAADSSAASLTFHAGYHDGTDVALISSHEPLDLMAVAATVSPWAARYDIKSVLVPWPPTQPHVAFREAQAGLRVARVGCAAIAQLRSRLFFHGMCEAATALNLPGDDPTAGLLAANPEFARALLAWLDSHGDVSAAATMLTCHVNTIRYRIHRARQSLPGDLSDPAFRLEVHLRLAQAMREHALPVAEQARSATAKGRTR